jgi:hypothetical protein
MTIVDSKDSNRSVRMLCVPYALSGSHCDEVGDLNERFDISLLYRLIL